MRLATRNHLAPNSHRGFFHAAAGRWRLHRRATSELRRHCRSSCLRTAAGRCNDPVNETDPTGLCDGGVNIAIVPAGGDATEMGYGLIEQNPSVDIVLYVASPADATRQLWTVAHDVCCINKVFIGGHSGGGYGKQRIGSTTTGGSSITESDVFRGTLRHYENRDLRAKDLTHSQPNRNDPSEKNP